MERLEARCLLAVFTVTTPEDAGPGSLRQALLDANANPGLDTIAFQIGDGGVQTIRPKTGLPQITQAVLLDGTTQPGFAGQPLIVLSGSNVSSAAGLSFQIGGNLVRGFVIQGFNAGISLGFGAGNNTITGNYLGTDASGTQAVGNGVGLSLFQSGGDRIGGTDPGDGNLISGNGAGISITSESGPTLQPGPSASIVIQGNQIGTDVTGTQAVPNGTGISIIPGSRLGVPLTLIGGTQAGAGNLISGNNGSGIVIRGGGHIVLGNSIGTDRTGTRSLGNRTYGVDISGTFPSRIGGTTAEARNLISGNGVAGVHIAGTALVEGNWIGTDSTGHAGLGNGTGIWVEGVGNTVGGTAVGAGNLISGNFAAGVVLAGSKNQVQGNQIGTDALGMARVSNGFGVHIVGGSNNLVGGTEPEASNLISGNAAGVVIFSSTGNTIQGNRIGTDTSGRHALSNGDGVELDGPDNLVGGTAAGTGNLISGNLQSGVSISSSGNRVQGNTIGADVTGTVALGNVTGVYVSLGESGNLIGGTDANAGNLISGNTDAGVVLAGQGNVLQGNLIGTDLSGTHALGNNTGVRIDGSSDNSIGGASAEARNVISGNFPFSTLEGDGILISAGSRNVIEGNYIGTDRSGSQALGNRNGICILGGQDNRIGGSLPGAGNVISGQRGTSVFDGVGILVRQGSGTVIQGNSIGTDLAGSQPLGNRIGINFDNSSDNVIGGAAPGAGNVVAASSYAGIQINGNNNRVQGNYVGTDATGTHALSDSLGLIVGFSTTNSVPSSHNVIGGTEPGAGNLISGNAAYGVWIFGQFSDGNVIQGNSIGTDVDGTVALANGDGIFINFAINNLIGGTVPGAGNLISGNKNRGIYLQSTGSRVQGNLIGTDGTGSRPLPNSSGVVLIGSASLLGGTDPGARNVISGNTVAGVDLGDMLYGAVGQQVQGNYIGTDVTGTLAVPNGTGVRINVGQYGTSSNNTIGGTARGAGNLISGNRTDGVLIRWSGNWLQGNEIGVDATGMQPLGNGGNGVNAEAPSTLIGGTAGGAGNTIAFNGQDGVRATGGTGITIRQNAIFSNGGLGIELLLGANRMQAAPELTSASSSDGILAVEGTLRSTPARTFIIEFFANRECDPSGFGEGEQFLASLTVATDGGGNASFTLILALPIDPGQFLTATATDPAGNTSQFSNCVAVVGAGPAAVPAGGRGNLMSSLLGEGGSDFPCSIGMEHPLRNGSSAVSVNPVLPVQPQLDAFFAALGRARWRPSGTTSQGPQNLRQGNHHGGLREYVVLPEAPWMVGHAP